MTLHRGDDDYMAGNITKIELCNFMTFSKLNCKPCSRLNLVIGPNGSGKSSLVCAIALGLGGEPQLLGRATSVGAYVKRGEESGYIRISLRGEGKEDAITITRKIDTSNKSEWLFNGKVVAKKEINEVIQRFNIQVNNLTQFLPQDRVCEFAKLTPVQLLEETEKAVGDPRLPVQHSTLIMKSQELKKFERAVESNKGSLDQLKALNAELERDVERVRQREGLLAKAESMRKKLPWLKYDMKKAEYIEVKEQEKNAELRLKEATNTLKELRKPIEERKVEKIKQEAICKKMNGLLDGNMRKRLQLLEDDNRFGVLIQGKYKEIEELRRQEESRQLRISKAKDDLAAAEVELENLPPYVPPTQKLEQLSARIMELEETAKEMRSQLKGKDKHLHQLKLDRAHVVDKLRDMENANNKRLQALKNSGADNIFQAYKWVNEHRSEFKKEVYGPVLLEVNVTNRLHADYLEGHIPEYIWKSFLVQDSEDRDFLKKGLEGLHVPVINETGSKGHHGERFQLTHEMQKLGITSRLDQTFEAPDFVKDSLIRQFGLDRSYIGSKESDNKADQVPRLGITNLWTPEKHYYWSESRYMDHVSALVDTVNRSRLLLCNMDFGEIDKYKSRKNELDDQISTLEASLKDLQTEITQKENEAGGLRHEREDIFNISQRQKKKRTELENVVKQRRIKLQSIEMEDDPDRAISKLIDQVKELKNHRFRCALKIKNLLIETVAYRRSFAENHFCSYELEAKIKEMEVNAKQQEKLAVQATSDLNECKTVSEKKRQQLLDAKNYAESVAVITPELKRAFLEMPTTVEDLQAAINDTTSQANSILFLNNNILEEYESRQRKIEELMDKQESDQKELNTRLDEINALKESWLPTLRSLVTRINETFSHNFQEMAVAGEVSLDEHGMDFDHYGILIKVKFRQTGQLQVLSAHHQSGGERSVSTILYLISLQDLTHCPFRVVDEINQGMDPINERKMFQQLVRAASQPNTPQCFLLTPKLLPNLEYSDACSILNVMNGPWIELPSKVWSCGDNWGTITSQVGENRS
ncbi:hypothetical protein RD792_004371 [Penstemon davidsonii]|uniref:Structural maintenance of chromosomes protein 5 n=1 Tax=Penstemon davidsonii TaxID=160366 RepID=A0ABR0DI05_9LAMI|nr:hypothetical protein RD792_004371 [Penstemon davidsonii]